MQQLYRFGVRSLLFKTLKADPETVHRQTIDLLAWLATDPNRGATLHQPARRAGQAAMTGAFGCQPASSPALYQSLWNLDFFNPLGLAAGFDKDGTAARAWPLLGFGFAELGTVTYHAQPGNPKPRLFRLPADRAALNRMGFNNQGAAALSNKLRELWPEGNYPMPIGINLGKSKITPLDEAAADYRQSFELLKRQGSYFVVNVSSPNTPGLRSLQATEQLAPILETLQSANTEDKPLLVKISPNLATEDITEIVQLAQRCNLAGIIATNTTIDRKSLTTRTLATTGKAVIDEAGGISGAPVRDRSTEVIHQIYAQTNGTLPIIGVGGIFNADDAWAKITAGASLLQTYTGWVYEGPGMVKNIASGLADRLQSNSLKNISAAVGLAHRQN
ncbi:quinone-dependent dihydroorotate dehydrogenase [cf. Phormidesmis sp. LEGE 11477]|uniref:quinone-dependent dihydroorotate dehydrogenase n=1 Tax=cf. Phormidesmis sp. LEGE 11477 TaxID=1828680 RepID=UPI00187EBFC3|nr:quinone-dependent dihydroorotate dehydrogenase [cf. Phormidesmis sp. LEGE 11477]MBE9063387.1 quinone-dependent dihydroorotate dehydrogenase [cf. Phormidesmis sp. LEGE 11477]